MANDKTRKFSSLIVDDPIAIIENGNSITIDAENRVLNLDIPQQEIGVCLAKYAKLVCSASEGAITNKF